jgi:hypothetical protein
MRLQPLAVDEGAIGASKIFDCKPSISELDFDVFARDCWVEGQHQVAGRPTDTETQTHESGIFGPANPTSEQAITVKATSGIIVASDADFPDP